LIFIHHLLYLLTLFLIFLRSDFSQNDTVRLETAIELAYKNNEFDNVLKLTDSLRFMSYNVPIWIRLREAQAAMRLEENKKARKLYQYLLRSGDTDIKLLAYNQLGTIEVRERKYKKALEFYKNALELNSSYQPALYNYEYVAKKYIPKAATQPPPIAQQAMEEKMEQNLIAQQTDEKNEVLAKTPAPEIGRERALQLLDAMRTNEGQGIKIRKSVNNRKKSEKDW
jgi:tetratricopeptide (TPR) repeat protein